MLFENEAFDSENSAPSPATWSEHVFRGCTFDGGDLEGIIFGGVMDECTMRDVDLYWAFFNVALVARTRFENCTFRGASFRGTTFVECRFVNCSFELDNLGSDCTIDECLIVACGFETCTWVAKAGSGTARSGKARSGKAGTKASGSKKDRAKKAKPTRDGDGTRDITNSRWLECTQQGCRGFDGIF